MNMQLDKLIDLYDLKARVAPALLVLFPTICTLWLWQPGVQTWLDAFSGSIFVYLLAWFLGRIARDKGVAVQKKIFDAAGGNITALMLRHEDSHLNPLDKDRYRRLLEGAIAELSFPANKAEDEAPNAIQKYEMAVNWLRRNTRDTDKFSLLFKDNMTYGFHRNLYAMKHIALFFSIMNILGLVAYQQINSLPVFEAFSYAPFYVSGLLHIITIIVWVWFIDEKSVVSAAKTYAERLLEATEIVCTVDK